MVILNNPWNDTRKCFKKEENLKGQSKSQNTPMRTELCIKYAEWQIELDQIFIMVIDQHKCRVANGK